MTATVTDAHVDHSTAGRAGLAHRFADVATVLDAVLQDLAGALDTP